jgi:hypothetical protein
MNALRVEELESRDLLNGAPFAPPIHMPMLHSIEQSPSGIVQPTAFQEFDGERPAGGFQTELSENGPVTTEFASVRHLSSQYIELNQTQPVITVVVVEWVVIGARTPERESSTPASAPNPTGTVTITAGNPKSPMPEASVPVATQYGDAPSVRATPAAVVPSVQRVNLQSAFQIVPSTINPAFATDGQNSGTSQGPVRASFRPGDGVPLANPALNAVVASSGAGVATPTAEEAALTQSNKEAPPIGPGVLATLATGDLSALGRELEQFLARIERAGEELIVEGDGLRPWLIAGAAAATACEIARRQLKRAAELAADGVPESLPDHLIVV